MARADLLNKKQKSKLPQSVQKKRGKHRAKEAEEEVSNLTHLQDQIGNQATQRLLARRSGQGSLKLDQETIARLQHENGPATRDLAHMIGQAEPQLQGQASTDTVQREEGDEEAPQAQPSDGEVTIEDVETEYYDVTGSTLEEVAGQLDPDEWGRCTYHYDYNYETTNGHTTKVDITLKLTIRLPRWQGKGWEKASPAAKKEWLHMLKALEKHEVDHADIARQWAPKFKERLLNQKENKIQKRYNQTLQKVNQETKQFDQKTKHGQNQGVSLDTTIE
jgi:predicted secreted Zn-dependent protease